jgi:inositol transporter-like SP family MFS transporter
MRRRMSESKVWSDAQDEDGLKVSFAAFRELLSNRRFLGPLAFLTGMYGLWNLMAGTNGFYLPFILRTVGSQRR